MPVEQPAQRVTLGDGAVQDPQELGTNVSRDTGVPRRIKPEHLPPPAPVFSPTPFVLVVAVELMDVDFLVCKLVPYVCLYCLNFFLNRERPPRRKEVLQYT